MEAEKAVEAAPESNQAGDPFATQTTVSPVTGDGITVNSVSAEAAPEELGIDEALKTLEALDEEEAAAEEKDKNISRAEMLAIVKATSQAVTDADAVLKTAKEAYKVASLRAAERQVEPTLVELNRAQWKHTRTEQRHKRRAMKALGELGYGAPKTKPHPPLFKS